MLSHVRAIVLACGITALGGPVTFAAWAAAPTTTTFPFYNSFTIPANLNSCGFDITVTQQGTEVMTTFTDASGTQTRAIARTPVAQETLAANGKLITAYGSPAPGHFDLLNGTLTVTGKQSTFKLPGKGVVGQTAGRQTYAGGTSTWNGNFTVNVNVAPGQFNPITPAICAALSP